jgi:signal transduction histidine kinase
VRPGSLIARLPIRAKLTLAYSGVIAVMLGVIGLFLYFHFRSGLDDGLNATLRTRASDVSVLMRHGGINGLERHRDLLGGEGLTAQVLTPGGRVLFTSSGLGEPALLTSAALREAGTGTQYIDRRERERFLVRRPVDAGGAVLVVAASLRERERALELLNGALLVGGGLTLLLASLAGYGLAGAVLRPMERMRQAAGQISDVDPHARLPLPVAEDEVHRLGVTLNDMLARLEQARSRERSFLSDASHELRTPLAILKTEVEVALRTDNPPEALRAALQVAGEEADRLIQLAEDLLVIARSDSGRMELDRSVVGARRLLEGVGRRFRVRAREGDRPLVVQPGDDPLVAADAARVEQALSSLVDNALRHGDGPVTLRACTVDGAVELHVLDEGPGVPEAFLTVAFERFSRAHAGRTGGGSGLGLAIVRLIANAHGGDAGLTNRTDVRGLDVWVRLPAA